MIEASDKHLVVLQILREIAAGGSVRLRVSGECMAPWVRAGAEVRAGRPRRIYWPGDVVVLQGEDGFLLHRVIGGYRRRGVWKWLTQADAAARPDRAVRAEQIVGRVVGGECAPALIRVPLRHRLWAAARFIRFVCRLLDTTPNAR